MLGAFGYFSNQLDGQTIKTRNVYALLKERYEGRVDDFDTLAVRKNPLLLFVLLWRLFRCNTLIIVPCLNNLTYIFPIVYYLSKIFRYEIIHMCIGGWQIEYFKGNERFKPHRIQLNLNKRIRVILPEMKDVDWKLKMELGFRNSEYFPNFRFFKEGGVQKKREPGKFRLVFMARINKKKGYPTIFKFVEFVRQGCWDIKVDFYGPLENEDKTDFLMQVELNKDLVTYKGILQPEDIHRTLGVYDLMLLPTTYYTEGFPGSVLDAYIAGIPVIATNWKYAHEFIDDGVTGCIVPFNDCQEEFNKRILELYHDREKLEMMKTKAREKCRSYSADVAWNILSKYL